MLRNLKNMKAQVMLGEYLLVFFLVVGMISAMTIYIRRTLQGRIRDARYRMVDMVKNRTGNLYTGTTIMRSYEPYYANTESDVVRSFRDTQLLFSSNLGSSGLYQKDLNQATNMRTNSTTAAPKDAF